MTRVCLLASGGFRNHSIYQSHTRVRLESCLGRALTLDFQDKEYNLLSLLVILIMASSVLAGFRALPLSDVQLSLAVVLKCGQSFRWTCYPLPSSPGTSPTHEYRLCLRDRVVCLRQSSDYLYYRSVFPGEHLSAEQEAASDEETLIWLKDYFQLDVDLLKLYDQWSDRDQVFNKLKSRFSGIRVLRQDPWENLVSCVVYF